MLSYPKIGYKSKTTSLNINLPMENSNKKGIDKLKKVDKLIKKLDEGNWSLSDERVFMEKLYVGRFNYFLVVFSLLRTLSFAYCSYFSRPRLQQVVRCAPRLRARGKRAAFSGLYVLVTRTTRARVHALITVLDNSC